MSYKIAAELFVSKVLWWYGSYKFMNNINKAMDVV